MFFSSEDTPNNGPLISSRLSFLGGGGRFGAGKGKRFWGRSRGFHEGGLFVANRVQAPAPIQAITYDWTLKINTRKFRIYKSTPSTLWKDFDNEKFNHALIERIHLSNNEQCDVQYCNSFLSTEFEAQICIYILNQFNN